MLKRKSFLAFALTSCLLLPGGAALASEEVDEIEDLAGLLTKDESGQDVLYVMEGHGEEVLKALGAKLSADRKSYEAVVNDVLVKFPRIDVLFPGFFPQVLCNSRTVRVYRNAACRQTQLASVGRCLLTLFPSGYSRIHQNAVRKCGPGLGYCVEYNQTYRFRYNYGIGNSSCFGSPISISPLASDFIC